MKDREIILALFHPMTDHLDGCLFKGNHNLPCQCGFAEVIGDYRCALREAKQIAKSHFGETYDSVDPFEEEEDDD